LLAMVTLATSSIPITYNTDRDVAAEMQVSCTDVQMTVIFNGTELNARTTADTDRPWKVNFFGYDDTNRCNATKEDFIGGTSVLQLTANVSECGINVYEEGDYIVYNQTLVVTYGENPNSMIIREEYDLYNVKCYLNKTANGNFGSLNTIIRETGLEAKNSSAQFEYEFTHSKMNGGPPSPYIVGQKILFKVKLVNDMGMVKSVVQRCWTASENSNNEYKLIDNRCVSDTAGTEWYGRYTDSMTMFSTVAYKYAGASSSELHLECLVRVCPVGAVIDTSGVCSRCSDHPIRRRRDTDDYSDSDSNLKLIRSPVFYIVDPKDTPTSDKKQESDSFMAGTNGTIILVLLAMLVFVAIVAIIKKSFSARLPYNYQLLLSRASITKDWHKHAL